MTKNNDKDTIYGDSYRGYKINNGNNSEYSCYKDSLDKIINDIEDKTNRHKKSPYNTNRCQYSTSNEWERTIKSYDKSSWINTQRDIQKT